MISSTKSVLRSKLEDASPSWINNSAIAKENIYAVRPLEDGREFTIVKAFYNLNELKEKLMKLGFVVKSQKFSETFFFLSGTLK